MQSLIQEMEAILRKSISEEQEATSVYLKRQQLCQKYIELCRERGNIALANKLSVLAYTFEDIANEEELHIGQFTEMLDLLNISDSNEEKGEDEAKEDIEKLLKEGFVNVSKKMKNFL